MQIMLIFEGAFAMIIALAVITYYSQVLWTNLLVRTQLS
jgi:hypothetical protein